MSYKDFLRVLAAVIITGLVWLIVYTWLVGTVMTNVMNY